MESPRIVQITTQEGLRGEAELPEASEGRASRVTVHFEDGREMMVPVTVLVAQEDGTYHLPLDVREVEAQQQEWGQTEAMSEGESVVIPLAEEELSVETRQYSTGGVRVTKHVREREERIDEAGYREDVDVERVPVNRVIEEPVAPRVEGDTIVIPLMEEMLVVEKRLVLKEEVRITRRRVEMPSDETVTLRREEVEIEHIPGETSEERDADSI